MIDNKEYWNRKFERFNKNIEDWKERNQLELVLTAVLLLILFAIIG